jgi:hypothetical protein
MTGISAGATSNDPFAAGLDPDSRPSAASRLKSEEEGELPMAIAPANNPRPGEPTSTPAPAPAPVPALAQASAVPSRDEFRAKIIRALENIVTLRVTTVVGPVKIKNLDDFNAVTEVVLPDDKVLEVASTAINLVLGDITQVRTEKFAQDPAYAKLHDDALVAARSIIADNLATLKEVLVGLEKILWKG